MLSIYWPVFATLTLYLLASKKKNGYVNNSSACHLDVLSGYSTNLLKAKLFRCQMLPYYRAYIRLVAPSNM